MTRRNSLLALVATGMAAVPAFPTSPAIHLHVDLFVDPNREQEMVDNFHKIFKPAISRQPGFVEVRLVKLREVKFGQPPAPPKYRLLISFQTEELRQKWVASADHQKAWPAIEKTLTGQKFTAVLFDVQ
jgi:heme-degrading monooxygenase HmoA